jgi:hypothetical protein
MDPKETMAPGPRDSRDIRGLPVQLATWTLIGLAALAVIALISLRTARDPNATRDYPSRPLPADGRTVLLPSPVDDEYFPCSDCHEDEEVNPAVRTLEEEHEDLDFQHGDLWCMHCHELEDHENLHLADGTTVSMDESWRLCTQCHAKKLPDWRAGVHGKRTGNWRGDREYRTCVSCHNPHHPPFEALEPKPPPLPPTQITLRKPDEREAP